MILFYKLIFLRDFKDLLRKGIVSYYSLLFHGVQKYNSCAVPG